MTLPTPAAIYDPLPSQTNQDLTSHSIFENQPLTHGLEALSAAASGDHYSFDHREASTSYPRTAQDLRYILNEPSSPDISPQIDPRLQADPTVFAQNGHAFAENEHASGLDVTEVLLPNEPLETDEDVQFLLRYFSEGPGAWMDLFDLGSFFAVDVLVKASSCPLLLHAAIALSAKALGRITRNARNPSPESLSCKRAAASKHNCSHWFHKASKYYDRAVILLRKALMNETNALPRPDSDELIATTAILCVYEFLDDSGQEWSKHLDGAKSLFDIAKDSAMYVTALSSGQDMPLPVARSSKGRRAVFWNICRQDMLSACKWFPFPFSLQCNVHMPR